MRVLKRNGVMAPMKFDNVTARISKLTKGLSPQVSAEKVAQVIFSSMYDGMPTSEIDSLSAETAVAMITDNPDYEKLATRIVASNIQKSIPVTFSEAMKLLWEKGILADNVYSFVETEKDQLNKAINHDLDTTLGYFGIKTLEKSYLNTGIESPQYMFMRVSVGIHCDDLTSALETYKHMAAGKFIHATPTLFNAGTRKPQLSSCFLVAAKDDSIDGIYDTLKECAQISKWAGGSGCTSITFEPTTRSSEEPMAYLTVSYPCCVYSTRQRGTSTRLGNAKGQLQCTSNPGTPISWTSSTFVSIKVTRRHEPETCSPLCGSLTCS